MSERHYASAETKHIPQNQLALPALSDDNGNNQPAPFNTDQCSRLPSIHKAPKDFPDFGQLSTSPSPSQEKVPSNSSPSQVREGKKPNHDSFTKISSNESQALEDLVLEWTNLTREEIRVL
jgi:hypothetical protein